MRELVKSESTFWVNRGRRRARFWVFQDLGVIGIASWDVWEGISALEML